MRMLSSVAGILSVYLFFASVSFGQNKIRTLDETKRPRANQPISIVNREIENRKVDTDGTISAGRDWVKQLKLEVKNISSKTITFFEIGLVVPQKEDQTSYVVFPVRYGVPLWIDDSGKEKPTDRRGSLLPNNTIVVSVTEGDADAFTRVLRREGRDELDRVTIEVQEVQFDDDTGWTYGYEYRRDPTNRRKTIPLVAPKPNLQSLWKNTTDFFFANIASANRIRRIAASWRRLTVELFAARVA